MHPFETYLCKLASTRPPQKSSECLVYGTGFSAFHILVNNEISLSIQANTIWSDSLINLELFVLSDNLGTPARLEYDTISVSANQLAHVVAQRSRAYRGEGLRALEFLAKHLAMATAEASTATEPA